MANVKQGQTVPAPQWWKHLRDWKRLFWKKQRADNRRLAKTPSWRRHVSAMAPGATGLATYRSLRGWSSALRLALHVLLPTIAVENRT
jgi:hypothetical protein